MTCQTIRDAIQPYSLLDHAFYVMWSQGRLTKDILADYARQYYSHVEAFPRYISMIHSQCESLEDRQVLLENLIEEERGEENHPKLWRDFAEALGAKTYNTIEEKKYLYPQTIALVEAFYEGCQKSYASGLGTLYAYEYQTPEVARSKLEGLQKFYNLTDERACKFFELHQGVDVWHSQEIGQLIEKLPKAEQEEAREAAIAAAKALSGFLDGMMVVHRLAA